MRPSNSVLFLFLVPIFLTACSSGNSGSEDEAIDEETGPLTFETFSGIPSPLEGCACFFAKSDEAFGNQKYLFANDNNASGDGTGMAFMRVRDKVRQFSRADLEEGDNTSTTTYKTDGYTLTVVSNFGESLPGEAVRTTGTMTLKGPDGESVETEYIGTCGC